MPTPFSRSAHGLDSDRFEGQGFLLSLAVLILGGTLGWLLLSRIGLYEVSRTARLEVDDHLHAVESPLDGRVLASYLTVGREVEAGEVLVELEATAEEWQLAEIQAQIAALRTQLDGLALELEAEARALARARESRGLAQREAHATAAAAAATARQAEEEAGKLEILQQGGLLSEIELQEARLEAERTRFLAEGHQLGEVRVGTELAGEEADRQARIQRLERSSRQLEGELSRAQARLRRLEHEVDKRSIRAPVGGSLGEAATLGVGAWVAAGERLCTVIPSGELRLVADFLPAQAMGRIQPGQTARLHLDGFPALHYGTVPARVARVAGELREGRVRVELEIEPPAGSPIPLEHALPGRVEVLIDRVAPWELLLQAAGRPRTWAADTTGARR